MADSKPSKSAQQKAREAGDPVPISLADDGGQSRLHAGYKDNPDKPDPSSIAQIQELKDEGSDEK